MWLICRTTQPPRSMMTWDVLRRITLTEASRLPTVFSAADCGYPNQALLANTGCWVCRFDGETIVEVRAYLDSAMVDYTIHRNENLAWQ